MTMNDKLESYRRKKHKEQMTESITNAVRKVFSWNRNDRIVDSTKEEEIKLCTQSQDIQEAEDTLLCDNTLESKNTVITKVIYLLYFLLWITLYAIALEYQFGAVYFVLSALIFICLNTRSGPKRQGELSAYSVFNPNCEAIEGTLDASQFEREMGYKV